MLVYRTKLSIIERRKLLVNSLWPSSELAMRMCRCCESSRTPEKCKLGEDSNKCLECIRKAVNCNLAPFSPVRWARIQRQRAEKSQQLKESLSKVVRLQRELELLERKQSEMVEDEMQNISEIEAEDPLVEIPELPFNLSSERLEISSDFDWSALSVSTGFLGSSLVVQGPASVNAFSTPEGASHS